MIIYTTHVLAGPLMALVWAIDLFLILIALRWLLARSTNDLAADVRASIRPLADPVPWAVRSWLTRKRRRPVPGWLPWLLVLAVLLVARQGLLWILLTICQP